MYRSIFAYALFLSMIIGCGDSSSTTSTTKQSTTTTTTATTTTTETTPRKIVVPTAPPAATPDPVPAQTEAKPSVIPQGMTAEKADVGVGEKGHYEQGIITTPLSAYWASKEQMAFRIEIPKAMQMFKALNDRNPKDEAEFMKEIIKENNIQLPTLPAGHKYIYDPVSGELMVAQPKK